MVGSNKSTRPMLLSRLSQPGLRFAVAGAAALGCAVVASAPEAKAACLPSNNICSTFETGSTATPTLGNPGGFQFANGASSEDPFTSASVLFRVTGYTGALPIAITGISLSGDGIATPQSLNDVSIVSLGNFISTSNSISVNVTPVSFANSKLSFTIPAGLNVGTVVSARVRYTNGIETTLSSTFSTTSQVPGPLPMLGAGVAFGFSRRLRRRIAGAA